MMSLEFNQLKKQIKGIGLPIHACRTDSFGDHGIEFNRRVNVDGLSPTEYFSESGIADFADANNGICLFLKDKSICLYQTTNCALFDDEDLTPSTEPNHFLFGSFIGNLEINDPVRKIKRKIIESVAGSKVFLEEKLPEFGLLSSQAIEKYENYETSTHNMALLLTSYIVSRISGFLDFHDNPLDEIIDNRIYGSLPVDYFEVASKIISHQSDENTDSDISDFIKDLLISNYQSIKKAPDTNIIKRHFNNWGISFEQECIKRLTRNQILELGTIIIAMYDTSANSLTWMLLYLQENKSVRSILEKPKDDYEIIDYFDLLVSAVIEAIRLGGANPTSLWRKTLKEKRITYSKDDYIIPKGVFVWLDRYRANRNPDIFKNPNNYNIDNIICLAKTQNKPLLSLVARNRYEINSFSMVNTVRNPRKCPGRLFSIFMQSSLLNSILKRGFFISSYNLSLKQASSMPMPSEEGCMKFKKGK